MHCMCSHLLLVAPHGSFFVFGLGVGVAAVDAAAAPTVAGDAAIPMIAKAAKGAKTIALMDHKRFARTVRRP
jgi:hypothetical protein